MPRSTNAQVRILKLIALFMNESSESAPLRSSAILRRLEKQGICVTRATLKNDIALLRECGFDLRCLTLPTGEYYYMSSSETAPWPCRFSD